MATTLKPSSPRRSSISGKFSDEKTSNNSDKETATPTADSSSCYLSDSSLDDDFIDLELGVGKGNTAVEGGKVSVDISKMERECRICHMSLLENTNGLAIELGCCCKHELALAHLHCANTWFKIRGNKTCEICGSTARNVAGVNEVELVEPLSEANDSVPTASVPLHSAETRHFWQGQKFLNFLLACMVFAFVISWLFHFNVPS